MNILVTGANGQLGNEIREITRESRHNYLFTDVAELNITDKEAVRAFCKQHQIALIINCAAYTNVDKAEDEVEKADLINHKAVQYLAETAAETGATLIHVSTDYVFDGISSRPYSEDVPTSPQSVYGSTKLAGETRILQSGCRYLIFRTAWLYSAYGNNFVKTMRRLTGEKETLNVVFDQVGTPTYAKDLASLIVSIIDNGQTDRQGIYHYSNEGVCSWYDFAQEINKLSGKHCHILPCHSHEFPSKVKRPSYSVLDKTEVKRTFAVEIPYWRESLAKCIKELEKQ